jgi:hypothetical protein
VVRIWKGHVFWQREIVFIKKDTQRKLGRNPCLLLTSIILFHELNHISRYMGYKL